MKFLLLTLLLNIGFISNLFSRNRPLRYLVIESEHIMIGYVIKTFENKKIKDSISFNLDDTIAQISILEQIQGNIKTDTIELAFSPNAMSMMPLPRYFDDTHVIIFWDGNHTTSYDLIHENITLNKNEIEVYKQKILEMQKILKYSSKAQQLTETVEWLVKCVENKTTQYEGSCELNTEKNFMFGYISEDLEDFGCLLTFSQKYRLKKVLLETTKLYEIDLDLVDLVYLGNEKEIEFFLIKSLKSVTNDPYDILASVSIIEKLNEIKKIKKIDSLLGKVYILNENNNTIKIINKCIKLLE